jgi:GNAT superfamily N-acetyltransferase
MFYLTALVKASLKAGWAVLYPQSGKQMRVNVAHEPSVIVPIRSLGSNQRKRIATHLLSLSPADRYLRFGYAIQNEKIQLYVDGLNFVRDEIFGIFDRKLALLAVAHLAYGHEGTGETSAEFGVSVLERARGRGYGKRLFDRAAMHAGNQGVAVMLIHALSENAAMLNISRKAGARVKRQGAESEAYLQLPQASLTSRLAEGIEQKIAEADYKLKRNAKQFRSFLVGLEEVRQGVSEAQKQHPH